MLTPRLRGAATVLVGLTLLPIAVRSASAAPGELDPSFGVGGLATVDAALGRSGFHAVVPRPDGTILAAGFADDHALVVRYDDAGVPDPTFGTNGVLLLDDPATGAYVAADLALYGDGRFLTVSGFGVTVRRHLSNGDPDPSFGDGGAARVPSVDGKAPVPVALAPQADGKIVVAGNAANVAASYPISIFVLRLDEHGVLDPTFGNGGIVTTLLEGFTGAEIHALFIAPDGKILVGGARASFQALVVRYLPDGSLDPSFGAGGVAATVGGHVEALALQPDGKILAAGGIVGRSFSGGPLVERLLDDGLLDPTFAGDGVFDFDPAQRNDPEEMSRIIGVAVQADGKIVVAGSDFQALAVARLEPTGTLDPGFGTQGLTVSSFGAPPFPQAMALQPGGRALVAGLFGQVAGFFNQRAGLARYVGSVCGDATVDGDEECDDGNLVDGDGCDGNCTTTACGNGVVTAGEQCDDGNTTGGDCCAADCQLEAAGAPCDDVNQCTATSTCTAGICTPGPSASCDDGDACTGDTCDALTGVCRSEPLGTIVCQQKNHARENLEKAFSLQSSRFGSSDPDLLPPVVVLADTIAALSSAGDDAAIEVFDTATGVRRAVLLDPTGNDFALGPIAALGADLLVAAEANRRFFPDGVGRIDLYDGSTFALVRTFLDPTPETPGFATTLLGQDAKVLARDGGSHVVEVFDAASGAHLHALVAPGGDPENAFGTLLVAFGDHQVLVGDTGAVHLFDLDTGALVRTFVDPTPGQGAFGSVIAVHGDDVLVGGRYEGRVYAFDPTTGAVRGTFDDPSPPANTLFGDPVVVAGDDVIVGRGAGRVHVFDATTRSLRLTILDPLPSDGFCFGRAILSVFGDRIAIADPCFGGGLITGDVETGQVYLFDQETGALRTIVRNPEHDDQDHFTVVASWHDTLFTYYKGFSDGTIVAYRPCANGTPAFSAKCLDGPCVDPEFCPGPCDFMFCGVCTRCDTASVSCIGAPRDACTASARPDRTTLHLRQRTQRIDWQWKAGAALAPGAFGDPVAGDRYGICLYEEDDGGSRLITNAQPSRYQSWRRATDGSFVFRDRERETGVDRLVLQTGRAGRAGITARLAPFTPLPTQPVTTRLRVQLQSTTSDACWESVHDPADAGRNGANDFRGPATP
jgi:uncharacterized delta-60 repeat protein